MRYKTETYDAMARKLAAQNSNMLVPWYLMASHAYYDLDNPFLSDECYDWLCKQLDEEWDHVEHWHKDLIERGALSSGTGYQLAGKMPTRIIHAAQHLMFDYKIGDAASQSVPDDLDDLLGDGLDDLDDLLGDATGIDDLL